MKTLKHQGFEQIFIKNWDNKNEAYIDPEYKNLEEYSK
jgi:hypothetical protein